MFNKRTAKLYAATALGITSSKITYCKTTGRGFSNRSFCVVVGQKAYHVRLARDLFALDRKQERLVCEAAGMHFIDFDDATGNYVRPWINGKTVWGWNEARLRAIARLLRELHGRQPIAGMHSFDPHLYDERARLPARYAPLYQSLVRLYADRGTV